MGEDAHSFDRRGGDANVAALATRFKAIEETIHEKLALDLEHNTRVCTKLHDAVFGTQEDDGIAMKVQEMHDVFARATNGLRVLSAVGNGVIRTIEIAGKIAKPLIYIAMLVGAIVGLIKTGSWDFKL